MEFTHSKNIKATAILLFLAAITQPIYTILYQYAKDVDRSFLWKAEALIFVLLCAFAGAALVMTRRYALALSAIAFAAVLNVLQVGIGLVQFKPFFAAAGENPELGGIAGSIAALSFFLYNGAKILLGLAALDIGMSKMKDGAKALGGLTALIGGVALLANAVAMMMGRSALPEAVTAVAGASGVVTALLLALCLFSLKSEDA